jgi:glycosyltransferase involved in cell wall biosynthesis
MRIAQVAPLFESVPPALYGGSERVVSWLTEELVRLGHEVTLFASGDSKTAARLVPACEKSLWRDKDCRETLPQHVRMLELVFQDAAQFDIIHFHCDYIHFPLVRRYGRPSLTTLHGFVHTHDLRDLLEEYRDVPLVSISDNQRASTPEANWQGTIHHGLPRDLHTFSPDCGEYLAFLGRISREKGLERAIEVAARAGMPLKIAAKIYEEDRSYFEHDIKPLLERSASFVEFVGEVGGAAKNEFLGKSKALLFPVDWPEPFGLVMIESMACGTPVIGWRNGSVSEVIQHGANGFVVSSVDEAVECVRELSSLRREVCREIFETRFPVERMTADYLKMYEEVIHAMSKGTKREAPMEVTR